MSTHTPSPLSVLQQHRVLGQLAAAPLDALARQATLTQHADGELVAAPGQLADQLWLLALGSARLEDKIGRAHV